MLYCFWSPHSYAQCLTEQLYIPDAFLTKVDFADSLHGIVVGSTSLRTTNGGKTWEAYPFTDTTIVRLTDLFIHDTSYATAANQSGKLYRTSDGGASWNFIGTPPVSPQKYGFWDSNNGLCVGNSKVFRTTTGGATWNLLYTTNSYGGITYVTCFDSVYAMAIGGVNNIFRTTDRGNSWTVLSNPTDYPLTQATFISPTHGFVVATNNDVKLLRTTNGGTSWSISPFDFYRLNALSFFDSSRWISIMYSWPGFHLLSTTNGWQTWSSNTVNAIACACLTNGNIILIWQKGIFIVSNNNCTGTATPVFPNADTTNIALHYPYSSPASLTFRWNKSPSMICGSSIFQLSKDSLFSEGAVIEKKFLQNSSNDFFSTTIQSLSGQMTYFWRVALISIDETTSYWSGAWKFQTKGGGIRGLVFEDENRDGIIQEIEKGIKEVRVRLLSAKQEEVITDSLGVYTFDGIEAGEYQVIARPISPWKRTSLIDTFSVTLSLNDQVSGFNFGQYYPWNSVSGSVYYDQNENGIQDAEETGVSNWKVKIFTPYMQDSAFTDASGIYRISRLQIEACSLLVVPVEQWEKISPRLVDGYTFSFVDYDRHYSNIHFGVHPIPERAKIAMQFHDASYNRITTIQWGVRSDATSGIWSADVNATRADFSEGEEELPAPFPETFDVRFTKPPNSSAQFGNGSWVDMRRYYSPTQVDTYKISFMTGSLTGGAYPLVFSWSKNQTQSLYFGDVLLKDPNGVSYDMKLVDSLIINDSEIRHLLIIADSPKLSPMEIEQDERAIPQTFMLFQNYPNPFNPQTEFIIDIAKQGKAMLTVHNILGERVATLISKELVPGTYAIPWDASGLSSGIYFYQLQVTENAAPLYSSIKKMILLK